MRAKAIFVGGTASHVGKSWMTTAICRHLKQRGFRVAPFKAQNMSNNSYPCAGGGEIGRAQVAQAEACELPPEPDMNPILLKPTSDQGSQVVLNGKVFGDFAARDYYSRHELLRNEAHAAYDRLSRRFEYVVIEGAGSVAEMNLKSRDVVNLSMAAYANARGLLVADIDRGGVFASICGTLDLLAPEERVLIRSFAVNRFRGDQSLFTDGLHFIEQRTGLASLGVFPMARDILLDAEDGVSLEDAPNADSGIAVVALPHISNLTDFRLLPCQRVSRPVDRQFRWIVLPGTKNTIGDLDWLREHGLADWICRQHRDGANVLGICGGFQMLGESIDDPECVESAEPRSRAGLGLLPVRTVLEKAKVTRTVAARTLAGQPFGAYEIHMGKTETSGLGPFAYLENGAPEGVHVGRVRGTYLHGALESPAVLKELFDLDVAVLPASAHYDLLADWFRRSADMKLFEEVYL